MEEGRVDALSVEAAAAEFCGWQEREGQAAQRRTDKARRAWLRAAMVFGLTMSHDPERKVGSCIVAANGRNVSFGYNGLPTGVPDTAANWRPPMKNALVVHAEVNAAINSTFELAGGTCYVPLKPCHLCMGVLKNAGVSTVVFVDDPVRWKYENPEAFSLASQGMELVSYPFTVVEAGLLELFGATPSGYAMYGQDEEHEYVRPDWADGPAGAAREVAERNRAEGDR